MSAQALNIPDAVDLDTTSIKPTREFQACNQLLDDHDALERFYDENGYLFFRGVLNPESITRARDEMLAVAANRFGLVKAGDPTARWTGKPFESWSEESPEFAGISTRLIEHPDNLALLEKILGEPACMVPNVQYRLYPPNGPVTMVHQDGFYSPGIHDYKPLWIPLVPCPREVGGLMVAIRQHKRGYFHNLAKPTPFPIPKGVIDEDSWATTDYEPGDLLIVHPYSPHGGTPNTSDRLRVTFDTRVQSAANPSAFSATVKSVTPNSVTLIADDERLGELMLWVSEETYIRVRNPGQREDFSGFADYTKPGMHLVVVRNNDRAVMLRMGSQP
jgi:ectoine hydroxylase-related dioxygenase (phytanoyl-CoA dioxygenase family)